jgi:tRNA(adenine34) deaminase
MAIPIVAIPIMPIPIGRLRSIAGGASSLRWHPRRFCARTLRSVRPSHLPRTKRSCVWRDEARRGDYLFGAVIVRNDKVIARGRNLGKVHYDPTAHAEMTAIRRALSEHGSAALPGSTLYATGEPCPMCMGALIWCHVERLVFAASVKQLATKINQMMIPCADVAANAPFASITIKAGVLADEAMKLFEK